MGTENIDASLGLALSLTLFEWYRRNGLLQAEIHHVPGYRGRCNGFLHLVEGKVVACYLEDKNNRRHPISKEILIKVDNERGPFEWTLTPLPAPPSLQPRSEIPHNPTKYASIPTRIATLNLDRLEGWSRHHKMMLSMVYELVNGQHNIEEIKSKASLPVNVTEEALRVLLSLKVITLPGQ